MEDNWTTVQGAIQASRRRRGGRRRLAIVLFAILLTGGYLATRVTHWFEVPGPSRFAAQEVLPPSPSCLDVLCNISWPTPQRDRLLRKPFSAGQLARALALRTC